MGQAVHIISLNLLSDLKAQPGSGDNVVITLGVNSVGDGKGALYYWEPLSTEAEETVYNNIVQVTGVTTGRWKKVFQRMLTLPHGTLVINNGKKEFFCNATTNISSEVTINLTMDNTTNGTAIFSEIWFDDSKASVNVTSVNDAVSSCRKALTANLKQLTHVFFRGQNATVSILGFNVLGFRSAATSTPVSFRVEGI